MISVKSAVTRFGSGSSEFVGPARRWAVRLDAGELLFVDTGDLTAE